MKRETVDDNRRSVLCQERDKVFKKITVLLYGKKTKKVERQIEEFEKLKDSSIRCLKQHKI